jgi:hypothetical protein
MTQLDQESYFRIIGRSLQFLSPPKITSLIGESLVTSENSSNQPKGSGLRTPNFSSA